MSLLMGSEVLSGAGVDGAPIHPEAWKRAVYRPPPAHFSVEMLQPAKQSGNYNFGLRICPIREDGRSQSSHGSNCEYDIWRRWEDCLWFQDCLEVEYDRRSRAKIKRLQAGKGVRKQGVYVRKDAASSWDSLPPGPDPKSVAVNIHDYVPKLTKKGTLFRASQATVDQRFLELQACINGLFAEDVPKLIQDLRESRDVTDFFGYWRRDFDLAVKKQKNKNPESPPRASISSSVFSTYFTASNPNLTNTDATLVNPTTPSKKSKTSLVSHISPRKASFVPASSRLTSSFSSGHTGKYSSQSESEEETKSKSRRGSDGSVASSHGPPSPLGPSSPSPYIVPYDTPISFGHNPDQTLPHGASSGLESLPEDQELVAPLSGPKIPIDPQRRANRASHRSARVYSVYEGQDEEISPEERYNNRMSWQTSTSIAETISPADYLAELGTDFALPKGPSSLFPRDSVASFASFMTDSSADAIIPMSSGSNPQRSLSANSRRTTRPMSISEEAWSDTDGDLLDAYFNDAFGRPASAALDSRPETPVANMPSPISFRASVFSTRSRSSTISSTPSSSSSAAVSSTSSSSPMSSVFTTSSVTSSDTSTIADGHISVKVVHNKAIILLRISRTISFTELRGKVYEKFVTQEGVPLSRSFAMGYVPSSSPADLGRSRPRSVSLSSAGAPEWSQIRFIHSQGDWELAVSTMGRGKMTLRAIGEEAV